MATSPQTPATFPFKAVIFDMDGVIVDTEMFYCREFLALSEEVGMGLTESEVFAQVGTSHQDFRRNIRQWYARIGQAYTEDEAVAAFNSWSEARPCDYASMLNPGVRETLEELKARGVRLALASSSQLDNIRRVLTACGLLDFFEIIVSGEQFTESKPNPEIYLHTLELLGLPASACCCVEDSVPGITAGKAAGLTVFARREDRFGFSQAAADTILDTVSDLLSIR